MLCCDRHGGARGLCPENCEQERKPRAEVLWGGFGEKQKQKHTGIISPSHAWQTQVFASFPSAQRPQEGGTQAQVWVTPSRCTHSRSLTPWVPSLISCCGDLGASWPQQPPGHRHPPSPKSNRPATMSAGQQLKIARKQ